MIVHRCKKIVGQAVSVYEDGLPPYYNTEYHNAKLLQALAVFSVQVLNTSFISVRCKVILYIPKEYYKINCLDN